MAQSLKSREEISKEYQWHMEDLYADDASWLKDYVRVRELSEKLKAFEGHLAEAAGTLLRYLKEMEQCSLLLERVYVYANQKYHEDTKNSTYQGLADQASTLMTAFGAATAFFEPELLAMSEDRLAELLEAEPELKNYERYLSEIFRRKAHTLSSEMEGLLADAGDMAESPEQIFSMFDNADIQFPSIRDEAGEEVKITHGRFVNFLRSTDRRVRKEAFTGLYHTYEQFKNTLAAVFSANIKKDLFFAKARKYGSAMEMALDDGNIPVSVYHSLIEAVHEGLPLLHRYVSIRKKAMDLSELHMYDLYAPMVEKPDIKTDYREAKRMVREGLAPLGKEYGDILEEGFSEGWIDVYENEGKRSGAYSWGAYGTHPYVLLNYQEELDSVFTLAHEMGHAIHSWYSDHSQPYLYAGYKIFVAEVASTVNESLLMQHLIGQTEDKKEKAYLVNQYLEQFRTTFFRQTMFAEFELLVHKTAAEGGTLTADALCEMYRELNEEYFGKNIVIDPEIALEWARIPHFYKSFYVYQYATGYAAAVSLSRKILTEGKLAVDRYITSFLKGGSAKDPIDLLKGAGVDMSTGEPVREAIRVFSALLDTMERLMEE